MDIKVFESYSEMSRFAADVLIDRIDPEQRVNIGLATGKTPAGMYQYWVQKLNQECRLDNIHFYNIDEYCNVKGTEPGTCRKYLEDHFFQHVQVQRNQIHWLNDKNYSAFDEAIRKAGGFHTIILGVGENGHIAYNEPHTEFGSLTHQVTLTPESKRQHAEEFGGIERVPDHAVSIGIRTIMNARNIILMASGINKAKIIKAGLRGKISERIPVSVLQLHPSLLVLLDKEAASALD